MSAQLFAFGCALSLAAGCRIGFDSEPALSDSTARFKLEFDNTASDTDLVDFPVAVFLDSSRIDFAEIEANGQDILFLDADETTALPHEIEMWNDGDASLIWVKVPTIDANSETDHFWLYVGGGGPGTQRPTEVWAPDYRAVWHFADDPSDGRIDDSTEFDHDAVISGAMTASDRVPGGLGYAIEFDGVDDAALVGDPSDGSLDFGTDSFGFAAWIRVDPSGGEFDVPVDKGGSSTSRTGYNMELGTGDWAPGLADGAAVYGPSFGEEGLYLGRTVYLATVHDGADSELRAYADGLAVGAEPTPSLQSTSSDIPLVIAATADAENFLPGQIAELRIRNGSVTGDWVGAQQRSTRDTFISYGQREPL